MVITVAMLREKKACPSQVAKFEGLFGAEAKPTLANCRKAVKAGLDLHFAAWRFLPATAWKAYEEARAPAWKAYEEAIARAFYNAAKGV